MGERRLHSYSHSLAIGEWPESTLVYHWTAVEPFPRAVVHRCCAGNSAPITVAQVKQFISRSGHKYLRPQGRPWVVSGHSDRTCCAMPGRHPARANGCAQNAIGRSPRTSPKRMKETVKFITRFDVNRLLASGHRADVLIHAEQVC